MLQAGVRVFLHHLAGFKVTSEATQAVPQLPPSDIRLANLKASLEYFDIDISNPRLKQSLQHYWHTTPSRQLYYLSRGS